MQKGAVSKTRADPVILGVVKQVEVLPTEFKPRPLIDRKALERSEVEVKTSGQVQGVATDIRADGAGLDATTAFAGNGRSDARRRLYLPNVKPIPSAIVSRKASRASPIAVRLPGLTGPIVMAPFRC